MSVDNPVKQDRRNSRYQTAARRTGSDLHDYRGLRTADCAGGRCDHHLRGHRRDRGGAVVIPDSGRNPGAVRRGLRGNEPLRHQRRRLLRYIAQGISRPAGVGASLIALMAYNLMQVGIYGLFGFTVSSLLSARLGISVPWWIPVLVCIAVVGWLGG